MPTLRNRKIRAGLIQRLQRLTPETKPQWGKLDAPRLLCHLADTFEMSLGTVAVPSVNRKTFHHFPMKHLALYILPFPKNVPTPGALRATAPGHFEADRLRVVELIERLATAPHAKGPEHPFFGPLTYEEWNALQGKHVSHHLKQFGL